MNSYEDLFGWLTSTLSHYLKENDDTPLGTLSTVIMVERVINKAKMEEKEMLERMAKDYESGEDNDS